MGVNMTMPSCVHCGKERPRDRSSAMHKYCSFACSREFWKKKYKTSNPSSGIPSSTVGAISELIVAVDLMQKGWEVFRSLSPSCSCDLAILKNGKLVRIEVKTGRFTTNGRPQYPKNNIKADIVAVNINSKIHYIPEL